MKFSACCPTYQPHRTKETGERLFYALDSARYFDELVVAVEGKDIADFHAIKEEILALRKDAVIVEVTPNPTPLKERLSGAEYFNMAVEASSGDYISLLCDDDEYCTQNVKILLQQGEKFKGEDIVYTPYFCMNPHGQIAMWAPPTQPTKVDMNTLMKVNFLSNSAFIRREVWDALGGRRKDTCCDWDQWIRALKAGYKFEFFPYPIYMQRFYPESLFMRQRDVWGQDKIFKQLNEARLQ